MSNGTDSLGKGFFGILDAEVTGGRPDFESVYAESARRVRAGRLSARYRLVLAVPIAAVFALALPLSFMTLTSRSQSMRAAVGELSSYSLRDASWEDGIYGLAVDTGTETEMGEFLSDIWNL